VTEDALAHLGLLHQN